jgi:hypothetical protein
VLHHTSGIKNGRVSEEAQPTSNQKTIVLQKEFSLIGADCHHPTPAFRLDYIFIYWPKAANPFQKRGTKHQPIESV